MAKRKQVNLKHSDIVKILRVLPTKGNEKLIANLTAQANTKSPRQQIVAGLSSVKPQS